MCFENTSTQTGSSSTNIPQWLEQHAAGLAGNASSYVNSHPYQGYTGPTQGAFGQTFGAAEQGAMNQAGANAPAYQTGLASLQKGLGLAGATASTPVSALMSQYTGAALNPTIRAIQGQAAQGNAALASGATAAGAFGDTGYGTQKAMLQSQTQQNIGDATASAYDKAYNSALSTQQNALGQLMSGVGQASNLGSQSQSSATALNSLLGSLGSTVQGANQTGINTGINVNNQNQMGQLGQYGALAGILGGLPHSTWGTSTSTTTTPNNSGFGLLGSLLGGL